MKLNDVLNYSYFKREQKKNKSLVKIGNFEKFILPKIVYGNLILKSPNLKLLIAQKTFVDGNLIIEGNFEKIEGYFKKVNGNFELISPNLKSLKWLPKQIKGNSITIISNKLTPKELKYLFFIEDIFLKRVNLGILQHKFETIKNKLSFVEGINKTTREYIINEFFDKELEKIFLKI